MNRTTVTPGGVVSDLRAHLHPVTSAPAAKVTLVIEADVGEGCHIECHEPPEPFLVPTVLHVRGGSPDVTVGPVRYPPCTERRLAWSPVVLRVFQGSLRFETDIEIAGTARPGRVGLDVELRYQACTATACLPPATRTVEVALEVGTGGRKGGE